MTEEDVIKKYLSGEDQKTALGWIAETREKERQAKAEKEAKAPGGAKMTVDQLKKQKGTRFTLNERRILLIAVVECLLRRNIPYKLWCKHGFSQLYFADSSWLGYSAQGQPEYGPKGDLFCHAHNLIDELGLKKVNRENV